MNTNNEFRAEFPIPTSEKALNQAYINPNQNASYLCLENLDQQLVSELSLEFRAVTRMSRYWVSRQEKSRFFMLSALQTPNKIIRRKLTFKVNCELSYYVYVNSNVLNFTNKSKSIKVNKVNLKGYFCCFWSTNHHDFFIFFLLFLHKPLPSREVPNSRRSPTFNSILRWKWYSRYYQNLSNIRGQTISREGWRTQP